jgi:hypothetical protein
MRRRLLWFLRSGSAHQGLRSQQSGGDHKRSMHGIPPQRGRLGLDTTPFALAATRNRKSSLEGQQIVGADGAGERHPGRVEISRPVPLVAR